MARACARGEADAIRAFEATYFSEVDHVARTRFPTVNPEELRQRVRERLFVSVGEESAKIATFSGKGDLRGWVRVVAVRTALNMVRKGLVDSRTTGDEALAELEDVADDPELAYLKKKYREEFRRVFRSVFASLAPRERNLLRYVLRDRLDLDAVGAIYGVHRTTAGRWVTAAHDELSTGIREHLMQRLKLKRSELESVLRLIQSRIEISLGA